VAVAKADPWRTFGLSSWASRPPATLEFIRLAGTPIETITYRGAAPA
jgi:hypothetical protein